ncbi:MAG: DNA topology modulation protein [bacterium]|nr:DNA topology modulation protein [bacterium]
MKLAILGYSGCGKSTLAKYLGQMYQIPVLYLDTVQYLPDWKVRELSEAVTMVSEFMRQDSWVIDGNYIKYLQRERLEQADYIVFMDFPRIVCFIRAYKRYLKYRNRTRESMAKGCNEKMDREFVWWLLHKGREKKRRKHYQEIVAEFSEKTVIIKSQRQLDEFMKDPFKSMNRNSIFAK